MARMVTRIGQAVLETLATEELTERDVRIAESYGRSAGLACRPGCSSRPTAWWPNGSYDHRLTVAWERGYAEGKAQRLAAHKAKQAADAAAKVSS